LDLTERVGGQERWAQKNEREKESSNNKKFVEKGASRSQTADAKSLKIV